MALDRRTAMATMGALPFTAAHSRAGLAPPGDLQAQDLRVEGLVDPSGLDRLRPRFSWALAAREARARGLVQAGFEIVGGTDRAAVAAGRGALWCGAPNAGPQTLALPAQPLPLESHRAYWWAVRVYDAAGRPSPWSAPAAFLTGMLATSQWPAAWIAARPDVAVPPHRQGQARADMVPARPLPIMRRAFRLAASPRRAVVSVCGLGQYGLAINGQRVGRVALAPGWSNYRRSVLYDTYDVTALLAAGENVLAMMLGNGMYNVEAKTGRYTKFLDSFGQPKAILAMTIEHADGRVEQVTSDALWRWLEGPIRFSSIYGGEDWDARLVPPGWMEPGFDDRAWQPVHQVPGPGGALRAGMVPPVVAARSLAPVSMAEIAPDVVLVDFGVNFAGRPRIVVDAPAGATLTVVPGEALDDQGRVSQRSFNAGPGNGVQFTSVCAGRGPERFEPLFTYHGFRWLELRGLPRAAISAVEGLVLHADLARVGQFHTDDRLLNGIHGLIDQAVTSNMVSVLTDCPHREKLGWLEQTYLNAPTVLYNRDAAPLYDKLVCDIAEAQQDDGMVPGIAPEYVAFQDDQGRDQVWRNSPEWGAAAVQAPWAAYRLGGDATLLAAAWPAAQRYCAYLAARAVEGTVDFGMGDWYDLGPNEPGEAQLTSRALVGTATRIACLQAMARIAPLVGQGAQAADFAAQAARVTRQFNARFLDPATGRYERGSQTAQAMPLALDLVPPAQRQAALTALIAAIRREGNSVTAGDIGYRYVLDALAAAGRDDVILAMLKVRDRPGYAMQLARGATALTEAWDANPTKSLNHFMLGQAEDWFYRRLAGLDIDHGRTHAAALRVAPQILPGLGSVAASHRLREGVLSCAWRQEAGILTVDVAVPAGRQAHLVLAHAVPGTLREQGRPPARVPGVKGFAAGPAIVLGSGHYRWTARAAD
ncbi:MULTISPECIES: family 78 glycoside hydrolase catalytic domain [unclassified Novosphingobium]|uniref:family 78 glycoside hydrolase catalytic domain n=1 Tax=unclassified Novosphingobium TaxID=2644732 RepID=UPI00146C1C36|nr:MULTISPECIES: family 78 glycoside hydrolase catalytic domain [unclassified Novosphingobium]NMN04897.1 hypothetical protein [Novosphingobium sp. SG919]NMN87190.1 hypothetical protein [Novosphingobium sp. SG916]